ncbi:hypothetical protein HanLR1_Chr00c0043g0698701 [Helianthus annuus]|nr:hypothetical protein HanLR1_Chr00c0043g0698701 [Helianthus annuus]
MMKFMRERERACKGVEILDNDNVREGVVEYSAADMDVIREDWTTYATTFIFK